MTLLLLLLLLYNCNFITDYNVFLTIFARKFVLLVFSLVIIIYIIIGTECQEQLMEVLFVAIIYI